MIVLILLATQPPAAAPSAPTEVDIEAVLQQALGTEFAAFSTCIATGLRSAPPRSPASHEAAAIAERCRPQQEALFAAYEAFLATAPLSETQKAQSREAWEESSRSLTTQLEAALTFHREQQSQTD